MNRKVFIPCLPTRYDAATNSRVPSIDLNAAATFGELVTLTRAPLEMTLEKGIDKMYESALNVRPDDLILCVGDVVFVAALIAYVCEENGTAKLLRWDKAERKYTITEVQL